MKLHAVNREIALTHVATTARQFGLTALPFLHGPWLINLLCSRCRCSSQRKSHNLIRRRTAEAGYKLKLGCHMFRATGITAYLDKGGTLEMPS